jgi:hypothetical protein
MKKIAFLTAAAFSAMLGAASVLAHTTLYYDGNAYADSDFKWHALGDWKTRDRGLELDLQMPKRFYESCTSWTNMPNGYSDCSTAGVSDPSTTVNMGVGSYTAELVRVGTTYRAQWDMSGGWANDTGTAVKLGWQEVYRYFCPEYNVWCMNGYTGGVLHTSAVWIYSVPKTTTWYY